MVQYPCKTPGRRKKYNKMAKKRANGDGLLRKRDNGIWELSIQDGFQENGKVKRKSFYGSTQKEVKEKYQKYLDDKRDGVLQEREYQFHEWADIWFENHKDNISATTYESYTYTIRLLKRTIGNRYLKNIKAIYVEQMLKALRAEGYSMSQLTKCRGVLYSIMNKAEANDLIRKNPVRFAYKMRYHEPIKRKDAFTAEEVAMLMKYLPDDKIGYTIRLMLGTGMRTQEVLALEPRHIALDGSVIHIEQAINMVGGKGIVGKPKSRDSYRDIPVPENLRYCAIELRSTPNTFIWEGRVEDQPASPSHFRKLFTDTLDSIPEVRMLTPHSCRHTYVSQMQALGVDLSTIQSIVGHADTSMTVHYLHVQDSVRQEAISKFSEAFPTNHTPTGPYPYLRLRKVE